MNLDELERFINESRLVPQEYALKLLDIARAAKRLIGYMKNAECGPLDAPADALRSALAELDKP